MTQQALERILQDGDMLEKAMFNDEEFANSFSLYPLVWSRYVETNRENGQIWLTSEEWMRFAERHYTAIVRCWNARSAKVKIKELCEIAIDSGKGTDILDLHGHLVSYFCSVRSAIDNVEHAFECEPIKSVDEFNKVARNDSRSPNLRWMYERGTQFVHKAVVPCHFQDGVMTFDISFFDDTETKWDEQRPVNFQSVTDVIDNQWSYFVDNMHAAWCRMLELLRESSPKSHSPMQIHSPPVLKVTISEPTAPQRYGWPTTDSYISGVIPRNFNTEGGH